jgi:hypothetical protein
MKNDSIIVAGFRLFSLVGPNNAYNVLSLVRVCCVCVSAAAAAALYIDAGLIDVP